MTSPIPQELLDEQLLLERDQIDQGLKGLTDNTIKLENKSYASATVYGISSIDALLPKLVAKIKDTRLRVYKGHTGIAFKEIHQYLKDLEPLAAAAIACKVTFDRVFSFKEGSNIATNVLDSIGHAVEDECQIRYYEKNVPALLATLQKNYWHKSCGTHQKVVVIQTLMNRYNVSKWEPWGRSIRVKLGGWLLDCIMETSEWFFKQPIREGRKTVIYVLPTPEFLDMKDEVMATAGLYSPLAWPMLVPPNNWEYDENDILIPGGYMLNEVMEGHDLVRRGEFHRIQGETPLAFLNKIQKVGYKLNPFIVEVAETLQEKEISVGKFLPIIHYDLPPKPVDIAENKEARKDYRRKTAEVLNRQAQETRRSCRTRMTMEAVKRFKNRERFYIPWSFDYRGRSYPIPAFLTPQDTDFGKSLLVFADSSPVTHDSHKWLAFQVATTYGLDKHNWDERQQWVKDNLFTITRVATDPINYIGDWEGAEEPWQFLAACEEYYNCVVTKTRTDTRLCVATDATCSGLQILAGLARDRRTAQLVNVLPSDRPQDAYKVVADKCKPNCPDSVKEYMDRKTVKRSVMTIPYNAKPFSNRSYIRDALKEKGVEVSKEDLTLTVRAVREAMSEVVPGCLAVMKWIEDEVSKAMKRGDTSLRWVTPSGFEVNQRLMKRKVETIDLKLLGRCRLSVATDEDIKVDKARHKAATAPNLIHSLDATLLHLSVERFDAPIALIHDSVLSRATDMSLLSMIVRETYMHLFAENNYLQDFADAIGSKTKPPIIGDLEPKSVIDSTYFFC